MAGAGGSGGKSIVAANAPAVVATRSQTTIDPPWACDTTTPPAMLARMKAIEPHSRTRPYSRPAWWVSRSVTASASGNEDV